MDTLFLDEHRCQCGKLLLRGIFFDGALEIKCKKCGTINSIDNIKLADDATHYLLIINDRGIIVNASNSAGQILGYARNELIGKSFTQINPTMPKEIGRKFFGSESVLVEDNFFKLRTTHQTKTGQKLLVTVLLRLYRPLDNKRYVLLAATIEDAAPKEKKRGGFFPPRNF